MSRKTKFRVWDKFNEDMFYSNSFDNLSLFFAEVQKRIDGGNLIVTMDYIGINDNSDKDIYESDICKIHVFTQELGENMGVMEGEKEFISEIHFGAIGMHVKTNYGDDNLLFYDNFHEESFEVIGNIYESPELLGPQMI